MRWPLRSNKPGPADIETEKAWSLPAIRSSPGLQTLLSRAEGHTGLRVLDLGPSVGSNVEFLARFADHIRIADLMGAGDSMEGPPDDRLMFPESWGFYNLILAWDVFNYLDADAIRRVVAGLEKLCEPRAGLFAIISTSEQMSARSMVYRIIDDERLEYQSVTPDRCPGAGLTAAAMDRYLGEFEVERSFVLRHGVLELVAVKPEPGF
jgi:hypothetical protein